jgi:hypothetical protein
LNSPESRSIHYQRRRAYISWGVLLLLAIGALIAWRIPVSRGEGQVLVSLKLINAPSGAKAELWCGPTSKWKPGKSTFSYGRFAAQDGSLTLGPVPVPVARRRWMQLFHPDTADLIMLRFSSPDGRVVYASYSLKPDLHAGLLGEHRKMKVWLPLPWNTLSLNVASPSKIQ